MQDCGVQCEEEGHCGLTETSWEFGDYPIVKSVTTYSPCPQVFPLQYLEVSIEGNQCTALNDSGCQISIVSNRLFGWCAEGAVGRVNLHGFGQDHVVQAPLVNLTVKICDPASEGDCGDMHEIPLVCAVTDLGSVDCDVILLAAVVSELQAPVVSAVLSVGDTSNVDPVTQTADFSGQVEPREADILSVDIPEGRSTNARSDGCVDGCVVGNDVDDADAELDHVVTPANVVVSNLRSAHIEEAELERLVALRSRELPQLVDGVADRVGDVASLCDAAIRRVQTSSDFVTRQMLPCRVPDRSRPEVDRTSHELLLRNSGATFVRAERTYLQPIRTIPVHMLTIWLLIIVVVKTICRMCDSLLTYYREYVPRYAEIAKPLTDLTRDCVPCKLGKLWTEESDCSGRFVPAADISSCVKNPARGSAIHTSYRQ